MKLNALILILFSFLFNACSVNSLNGYAIDIQGEKYPVKINTTDAISIEPKNVEAGEKVQLMLTIPSRVRLAGFFLVDRLYTDVVWSISPKSQAVELNPTTGELKSLDKLMNNRKYTIQAKIKGLKEPIKEALLIYSKQNNPLIGHWHEKEIKDSFNELIFHPNGEFSFTAVPFESYKDYWGTYQVDTKTNTLSMKIIGGNNKPTDAQLKQITYELNHKGELILKNFYYGTVKKGFTRQKEFIFIH